MNMFLTSLSNQPFGVQFIIAVFAFILFMWLKTVSFGLYSEWKKSRTSKKYKFAK